MQCMYRCTRCGTGWLATMVEHGDWGVAVHVFLCSHCRYASQPGVPVAVQDGASALPIGVRAATVPVARLTGPGVDALRLEELLMLLGLLPDAPGSAVQRPALVRAGHTAGVSPVMPEDEGREDRRHARGKMTGDVDQQPDIREGRRRLSRVGGSRSGLLTLHLQPAGTVGSRWRQKSDGDTVRAVSPPQAPSGKASQASQRSPYPRRWGDLAQWRHQGAENHRTMEYRVVPESTMPTHWYGIVPARIWHIMRSLLAHGRAMRRTWQQRRAEWHDLRCLLSLDDRLLADIGLKRFAVPWEARRPFWSPFAPAFAHGSVHHARHRPRDPWQMWYFS